jgi:hypothetical protein
LTYASARLREVFAGLDMKFSENWCAVVVDACKDRINLKDITLEEGAESAALTKFWQRAELALESDSVHEAALVAGEAFVIVWPDEAGEPDAYYNDPRLAHVVYDTENPRRVAWACKWWADADQVYHLTLYYPDRIEHYVARKAGLPERASAFVQEDIEPNPYGEVPVFHFTTQRRAIKSDLKPAVPLQDAINKLMADMLVAAEFGALRQRYIISDSEIAGKLKNAPNEIWMLPAGDGKGQGTQVGQFEASDLANYISAAENLATTLAAITSTPKHVFFGADSQLSGEALIAMEAPLVRKAQDRIDRFTPVWQKVAAFALKIAGETVDPNTIEVNFDTPATVQPRTVAEIMGLRTAANLPLASALRMDGMSEQDIAVILRERAQENAAKGAVGAAGIGGAVMTPERLAAQGNAEQRGTGIAQRLLTKSLDQAATDARAAVSARNA